MEVIRPFIPYFRQVAACKEKRREAFQTIGSHIPPLVLAADVRLKTAPGRLKVGTMAETLKIMTLVIAKQIS